MGPGRKFGLGCWWYSNKRSKSTVTIVLQRNHLNYLQASYYKQVHVHFIIASKKSILSLRAECYLRICECNKSQKIQNIRENSKRSNVLYFDCI